MIFCRKKSPSGTRPICVFRSLKNPCFSDVIKIEIIFVPVSRARKELHRATLRQARDSFQHEAPENCLLTSLYIASVFPDALHFASFLMQQDSGVSSLFPFPVDLYQFDFFQSAGLSTPQHFNY